MVCEIHHICEAGNFTKRSHKSINYHCISSDLKISKTTYLNSSTLNILKG